MRKLTTLSVAVIFITVGIASICAGSDVNNLTFINKSGRPALVKLVGPTRKVVEVPDGQDRLVHIAPGTYRIYVRYGEKGHYSYAKGESFVIRDVVGGYIDAQLTLHGVINGNYAVEASSRQEFERM